MAQWKKPGLVVGVLVAAGLLGGGLYALRREEVPEGASPRAAEVAERGGAVDAGSPVPRADAPAEDAGGLIASEGTTDSLPAAGTTAPPEVRSRSLASLRGAVSRGLRGCTSRITGGPVRVFVSMSAAVGGGRIRPEQVRVRTSSPVSDGAVRCVEEAVRSVSVPASAGEPDGAFPVTVSLLTGGR